MENFLTLSQVATATRLSKATIYRYRVEGLFPAPVRIGKRKILWMSADVYQFIDDCVKSKQAI